MVVDNLIVKFVDELIIVVVDNLIVMVINILINYCFVRGNLIKDSINVVMVVHSPVALTNCNPN